MGLNKERGKLWVPLQNTVKKGKRENCGPKKRARLNRIEINGFELYIHIEGGSNVGQPSPLIVNYVIGFDKD